jgi:DNA-binding CsgD family transcriptional regulator
MFVSKTRESVERLLAQGLLASEIARELGVAPQTVAYHHKRIRAGATDGRRRPDRRIELDESARLRPTRDLVNELLARGLSRADVARTLGLSKATISYHARRLNLDIDERCARRYDWSAVQRFHDEGHSKRECQARFGFNAGTWHAAMKRGDLVVRPSALSLEELFVAGIRRGAFHLKRRLINYGLKEEVCEECGLADWQGRPLSLALHHVNGDRLDNRLENLELLCPNCHSQTENFSGRNGARRAGEV